MKQILCVDSDGNLIGFISRPFPKQPTLEERNERELNRLKKELSIEEEEKIFTVQNILNLKLRKKNRITRSRG